jgi:protein tyrosine phosphatase (PTP) superfamily phosphohydrolase (DUF442 family)
MQRIKIRLMGTLLAIIGLQAPLLIASAQVPAGGYNPAVKQAHSHLKNFYQIDSGFYRSAQPVRKSFQAIKNDGITEILNLRRKKNKDSLRAGSLHFVFHQVPLKARDIKEASVIEALRVIKNRKGPILIHCWKGSDRTGLITALYRIIFDGWTKEDAIREMEEGGFGFHKMYQMVPEYIRQADIARIKKEIAE